MSSKKNSSEKVNKVPSAQRKIVDYTIVFTQYESSFSSSKTRTAQNRDRMEQHVYNLLREGWEILGGVSIGTIGAKSDIMVFAQTMVKYE